MKKEQKETTSKDLEEGLNIDINSEDGIEYLLTKVEESNVAALQGLVSAKFGKYIEEETIAQLVEAYDISLDTDEESQSLAVNAVYSTYMKEFG